MAHQYKPLTDAQQAFVERLKFQHIDHSALQIVVAAMHVRNHHTGPASNPDDPNDVLAFTIDKAAG